MFPVNCNREPPAKPTRKLLEAPLPKKKPSPIAKSVVVLICPFAESNTTPLLESVVLPITQPPIKPAVAVIVPASKALLAVMLPFAFTLKLDAEMKNSSPTAPPAIRKVEVDAPVRSSNTTAGPCNDPVPILNPASGLFGTNIAIVYK